SNSDISGTVKILLEKIGTTDNPFALIFELGNDTQVKDWTRNLIDLSSNEYSFRLSIDVKKQTSDQFFGIDDISYVLGDCASQPTTTYIPPTTTVCEFESPDICGFSQGVTNDFDWTHGTGQDAHILPPDHSTGNATGHYVYANMSGHTEGEMTSLFSPLIWDVPQACVAFSYFSTRNLTNQVEVWLVSERNPQHPTSIGNFSAPISTWVGARINVEIAGRWQIELRTQVQKNTGGFVGIDDLIVIPDACVDTVACDFEDDWCLWNNVDESTWQRGRVTDDPSQSAGWAYAPPFDHTTNTPYGHYLYFFDSDDLPEDKRTVSIISETHSVNRDSCFSFWLHMFGDKVGKLMVDEILREGTERLKEVAGSQGYRWHHIQVAVSTAPDHWLQLTVEGVPGRTNVIAFDDMDIFEGPCKE
ncbi:unnamed protein product, partial [Meganyctiphanes norvegica]